MTTISPTREQRQTLVDHALEWNATEKPDDEEARFADVVADLAADRPVADRGLLIRFLWQRVTRSLSGFGDLAEERRVWYAAVRLLDQLGEDLEDIFTGRPIEAVVEAEQACKRRFEKLLEEEGYRPRLELIAEAWNMSLHVVERMAELYEKQADDEEDA